MNVSKALLSSVFNSLNSTDWAANQSSSSTFLQPFVVPVGEQGVDITDSPTTSISDKPCGEALSSQTPAAVKLPGSLDALLYIVIVLMFYAFSIVILMVKYIRREREEANLRNYYHEFVSRDKFRSAQYKNRQFMKRIFGKGSLKDNRTLSTEEEEDGDVSPLSKSTNRFRNHAQTITRNGDTFSRLLVDCDEGKHVKESFKFLSAKGQFCRNGFFGKKFCNKQICSKCVSESAPTIDWDDGKGEEAMCNKHKSRSKDTVEIRLYNNSDQRHSFTNNSLHKNQQRDAMDRNYLLERDNSIFCPILECDSEKEDDDGDQRDDRAHGGAIRQCNDNVVVHASYEPAPEEAAIVSSCSLEVSELLANMPPLGAASNSNDMDTLDGLSNLDSEAESQSLLNYSASIRGANSMCGSQIRESPISKNKSASAEDRLKDLSDFLSERTSLLSCTLSIDDGDDEDGGTNQSSSKHHPNGLTHSLSNGKVKDELKANGKSLLNSISKSVSSDEEEMMKLLNNITMLTEESGVFKNLKYFLRSFSKHEMEGDVHEKSNLLPRETYFGPGSPKSFFGPNQSAVVPTKCDPVKQSSDYIEMDTVDDDLLNLEECETNYGNRWGYTYDEEDEIYSEGDKSSSFGEYCMGEASSTQIIDLSKPLVRRQLDSETRDGLSRAFIGLEDPWQEEFPPVNKANPMVAGYGAARKETKV